MTKFRKSLLIFGILVLIICAALGTYLVLSLTDSLKDERIALEFTVGNLTREYNAETHRASLEDEDCQNLVTMDEGYLIEGHEWGAVTFTGEQTEVGWCPIGLNVKIVDENGYDVTGQYKIKINAGILLVTPTDARIEVDRTPVWYDGTDIEISKYSAPKITDNGHRVLFSIKDKWFADNGKNVAGKTLNGEDIGIKIVDGNGKDVSRNYNIGLSCRVDILEREISIVPIDSQKPYDGLALECTEGKIVSNSLASGHTIAYRYETEDGQPARITDVGKLEVIAKATIYDMDGDEVTENYKIESLRGTLTVTKAELKVNLKPLENEYGKPFTATGDELCTLVSTMDTLRLVLKNDDYLTETFGDRTLGTAPYTIALEDFEIFSEDENVTDKFNISVNSSNLKIIPRKVVLVQDEAGNISTEYQGSFTFTQGIYLNGIADNHRIESFTCEPLNKVNDEPQETNLKSLLLVDEYGNNVWEYYNITNWSNFSVSVSVNKKVVTVYLSVGAKAEMDGSEISGIELASKLASGGYIKCDDMDVSNFTVENELYNKIGVNDTIKFVWANSDNSEYVDNYEIKIGNSEFVLIRNCKVDIDSDTANKTYDGEPINGGDLALDKLGLDSKKLGISDVSDYGLDTSNLLGVEDAGTYDAEITYVKSEYERITITGTYRIKPLKVVVNLNATITYNGSRYEPRASELKVSEVKDNGATVNSTYNVKAYTGKYVNVNGAEEDNKSVIAVGSHKMLFTSVDFVSDKGVNVGLNNVQFDITNSFVTVKIEKRDLSLSLGLISGSMASISGCEDLDMTGVVTVSNLAEGDVVVFIGEYGDGVGVVTVDAVDGSSLNLSAVKVFRGNDDVTDNYELPPQGSVTGAVLVTN